MHNLLLTKHKSLCILKDRGLDKKMHSLLIIDDGPEWCGYYELIEEMQYYIDYPLDDSEIIWGTRDKINKQIGRIFGFYWPPVDTNRDKKYYG